MAPSAAPKAGPTLSVAPVGLAGGAESHSMISPRALDSAHLPMPRPMPAGFMRSLRAQAAAATRRDRVGPKKPSRTTKPGPEGDVSTNTSLGERNDVRGASEEPPCVSIAPLDAMLVSLSPDDEAWTPSFPGSASGAAVAGPG